MEIDNKSICFFNSNKVWGGGEKWHHDASLFFNDREYSVLVITNYRSELFTRLNNKKNIKLMQIKINNFSFLNIFKIFKIINTLKENKINVIILNLPSDVKVAGIAAKLAGVKKIVYRRGLAIPVKNSLLNRFLFKYIISEIIANSKEIKNTILVNNKNIIDENRIHIIYNGVDLADFQINSEDRINKKGEVILGNVGRLVDQKGQKYLIDLARVLKDKKIEFKLIIAGKGQLEENLKNYAKELGVEEKVIFLGFVEDIKNFMDTIDIFLLSSIHEGSSNVLIEAMACRKPVVAFNISSNPEIVINNETGFLVEFPCVNEFCDKIINLIKNNELRNSFGKKGREVVENNFNKEKNLDELLRLLENNQIVKSQ